MSEKELSKEDKICYIHENINLMKKSNRVEVGKMIRCHEDTDSHNLINKGGGCQICFKFLSDSLINNIYSYVKQKLDN